MALTKRQREIIDLSAHLIAANGIQALTIKNLAEHLGVTEPALYRHFTNKNAILLTMIDDYEAESEAALMRCDDGSMMGVEAFVKSRFELARHRPELMLALSDEALFRNEPEIAAKLRRLQTCRETTLSDMFAAAQRNGEIRADIDHALLAVLTLGPVRLLIRRWCESDRRTDLIAQGNALWNAMRVTAL